MGSIRKQSNSGGPLQNCSSATDENELRVLENPMYNGIPAHGEEESHLSSLYDTPMEKQTYSVQSCVESNVYDYASLPQGGCPQNGNGAPLECYSAVDYYSTLNEYSYMEQDYGDIIKKVERCGGAVEEDGANLYYSPAEREDELYQQLQKQRIKSIPSSHIKKLGVLGSGEFGTVCKGQWVYADKKLDVAIKVLSDASDETSKVKFLQEAAIMSQFRHPNVIKLYGVVSDGREIMLIVELLEKGDLRQALNKMRPDPGQLHSVDLPLTLLAFSRQTALGMLYLSGKGFVHRDIAARNILLSHNNICKISDFGMSRDLEDENYYMSQGGKVPVKWTAPEALAYKKYSTASDVWSYGCLLYEIWSLGHKPFEGYTNQEVVQQLQTGYRLPPPPGCPEAIYNLMMDCWNPDPAERPTFQQILLTLLGDDKALLAVPTEERASHSLAGVLGSPLEAGHSMYLNRQNSYLTI
ncbi:Ephrin type-A receptor 8 (Fragment) [Geodia barretti]